MASTEAQLKALAITPKITSSFSMICSGFIIKEVIEDHRRNKGKVTLRALLGMSVIDILVRLGLWSDLRNSFDLYTNFSFSGRCRHRRAGSFLLGWHLLEATQSMLWEIHKAAPIKDFCCKSQ